MSKVVQSAFVLFIATMASKVVGFLSGSKSCRGEEDGEDNESDKTFHMDYVYGLYN